MKTININEKKNMIEIKKTNMVIGNGMLAKAFLSYNNNDEYLIFASGISNSLETSEYEFQREKNLILEVIKDNPKKTFVYFSTCSMYDPAAKESMYVKHKLEMEQYIKSLAEKYCIFRISQIVGKTNNTTLINFLINKILSQESFDVWKNSTRNLIDVEDVFLIVDHILRHNLFVNKTINIANTLSVPIIEIINIIEKVSSKPAYYKLVERGYPYELINVEFIENIIDKLNINFGREYYFNIIKKYYSQLN